MSVPAEYQGKTITCKAAVAWSAGEPLVVENIEVDPPRDREVRIKILYTGLCHTDVYTLSGQDPEGAFPCVLGHEGGGIVESVGSGVIDVKVGDHVIPLYTAECRKCKFCRSGKTNLCSAVRATQGKGVMPDGTSRFRCRGEELKHFMGVSSFAQYTVVADVSVVVIPNAAPLEKVCLLGCGITTGYGAVTKIPDIGGSTLAVFGVGCVGLSALQGASAKKCRQIIAIDTNPKKEEIARRFGATHFINPLEIPQGRSVVEAIIELTDGGADYTFDCTGNVNVMRNALESCHKGWGECVIIGVAPAGEEISTRPFQLVTGRVWRGSAFGGVKGRTELPGLVQDYLDGRLWVDEFITHYRSLEEIASGFEDMKSGECIRCVVDMR